MSCTKRYLEANALWNETLSKWVFTDGYGENPPPDILQLRLNKAEINHSNSTNGITITEVTEVQKID